MEINQKKEKKQLNSYIQLSSIFFQMMIVVLCGTYLGVYIDSISEYFNSLFTVVFSLLSVFLAMFFAYKKVS